MSNPPAADKATRELPEPSPRPWRVGDDGEVVCITSGDDQVCGCAFSSFDTLIDEANAALIVRSVNQSAAVDALVVALQSLTCAGCDNRIGYNEWPTQYGDWKQCLSCRDARAALKAVEELKGEAS